LQATAGMWKNKGTVENVLLVFFFNDVERIVVALYLGGFP